ncbi:MAG: hypothetical protein N2053_07460, partial [Chitinispirillaceae bacterium]|nr:hypothetical protein [Chitinispirillaceae bacterium]
NPKWFLKIWNLISAQSCNCTKGCPYFNICFWEKAQKKASNSHIVIVNDSLLFSEHQFLEKNSEEIILIDDAHLLNYNCSRARSFEIDTNRLNLFLDLVNSLYQLLEESTDKKEIVEIAKKFNKILKHLRKESTVFLSKLTSIATSKYPNNSEYEFTYNQDFFVNVGEVDSLIYSLDELIDILIILKQVLSFSDVKKCNFLSSIVQSTRETSSQIKAELAYLTCADIENHIFVISGNRDKGWVKLKGTPINNSNFMAEIWNNHKGTLIFTSQSISIDNTFEYFNEKNGLDRCKKDIKYNILKTSDIANDNNIVIGCLNCSLSENSKDSISKVEEFVTLFHNSLEKNLLIISAKDEKLLGLYNQLRNNPKIDRNKIFLNAITLNKHNELEGMVKDSKNILLSSEIFLNQLELNEYGFEIILILDIPITPFLEEENRYLKRKDAQLPYPIAEKILKLKLYKGFMLNYGIKRGILVLINNPFTENKFVEILKKSMEIEFNIFNTINELIETGKKYYL